MAGAECIQVAFTHSTQCLNIGNYMNQMIHNHKNILCLRVLCFDVIT